MKITWRSEIASWLGLALILALAVWGWATLPDRIPVHWNITGQIDRYGDKIEGVLLIPALAVGIYLLLLFLPRIDPGRANYARFAGSYALIRASILVMLAAVYLASMLVADGVPVDIPTAVGGVVGGLLVALGAVFGKVRPNWFVGIRTPWTLSSEMSWTRTHRLGGWLFILMGIALAASAVSHAVIAIYVTIGFIFVSTIWLFVYSYLVWRSDPDRVPPAGVMPAEERG